MGRQACGPGWQPGRDWPWGGGVLSISQPALLCSLRVGSGGGALALPSPHPLGPHPNPPPEGHFSGSFSFPGRQWGGGKLPGWEEGLGADPGATGQPWRNGCSSSEVSADLMISPPPSLHAAERGGTLGPGGAFPGEGRDL